MRTRSGIGAAAAVALVAAGLAGCDGGDGDGGTGAIELPDLSLPALDGEGPALDLASLRGPAVVNLWATWCAPCKRELPDFQDVSARRDDVRFVGVDIGEPPARALEYLAGLDVTFEQFADPTGELTDALGVAGLPVTLVVDGDGDVVEQHLGPMSVDELEGAIDDATAG